MGSADSIASGSVNSTGAGFDIIGFLSNPAILKLIGVLAILATFYALIPERLRSTHANSMFALIGRALRPLAWLLLKPLQAVNSIIPHYLRRSAHPFVRILHRRESAWVAVVGVALLILFYWSPTPHPKFAAWVHNEVTFAVLTALLVWYILWWLAKDAPSGRSSGPLTHVIAWLGWEEDRLYSRPSATTVSKEVLNFLTYARGFGAVPKLYSSNGVAFDLLIADMEYLPYYYKADRLEDLTGLILPKFAPFINTLKGGETTRAGFVMGIPLRCGFQEILISNEVRDALMPTRQVMLSYKDLKIEDILALDPTGQTKIGIWNWYLPALSVLLAVYGNGACHLDDVCRFDETEVRRVLDQIMSLGIANRLVFMNSVEEIYVTARDHNLAAVYGAGSWALPAPFESTQAVSDANFIEECALLPAIPTEGLFAWIECATILSDSKSSDRNRAIELIKYWLSNETQKELMFGRTLRALPVTTEALQLARNNYRGVPPVLVLDQIVDHDLKMKHDVKIVPRRIPQTLDGKVYRADERLRSAWEMAWYEFEQWHKKAVHS
ncbi:MAG: extracellular solute-binding protein [Alphaproteobacteria bacterium]|nr:extracellular solute-binding protein [Alphaproteobacteria bacterium]